VAEKPAGTVPMFPARPKGMATVVQANTQPNRVAINSEAKNPAIPADSASFAAKTAQKLGLGVPAATRLAKPVQAARDASASTPQGGALVGDVFRRNMVARLRELGGVSEPVLAAFAAVPRHGFVDAGLASQAYEDTSLPIGLGQTISKPSVVARMLSLLMQAPVVQESLAHLPSRWAIPGRVLEIGTGCGYQAALLARLCVHLTTVERLAGLHDKARANLSALGAELAPQNCELVLGDGMLGYAKNGPYMGMVSAAGGVLPQAWADQLVMGGRIVAPVSDAQGQQWLTVVDKTPRGLVQQQVGLVQFVPLKSGTA
jgi:protein-L-isoaspartate(D-aspartate) O-methyltransferase